VALRGAVTTGHSRKPRKGVGEQFSSAVSASAAGGITSGTLRPRCRRCQRPDDLHVAQAGPIDTGHLSGRSRGEEPKLGTAKSGSGSCTIQSPALATNSPGDQRTLCRRTCGARTAPTRVGYFAALSLGGPEDLRGMSVGSARWMGSPAVFGWIMRSIAVLAIWSKGVRTDVRGMGSRPARGMSL
jgi:hypothetical protein